MLAKSSEKRKNSSWEEKLSEIATTKLPSIQSVELRALENKKWPSKAFPEHCRDKTFKEIYDTDRAGAEWCSLPGRTGVVKHYLRLQSDGNTEFLPFQSLFTRYCEARFCFEEIRSAGTSEPFAMLETPERSCSPTPYMPEQLSVDRRLSAHDEDSTSKYTTVPIKRELKSETDDSERFSRFMIKREPESESEVASESDFEREPDVLGPETPEKEKPSLKRELRQSARVLTDRKRARSV